MLSKIFTESFPNLNFQSTIQVIKSGPVAQWIRHLTTNQGIPGSSPGKVEVFKAKPENEIASMLS